MQSLYEELRLCEGGLDDQNLRLLELQLKVLEGALQKAGEVANKWTSSGSGKTTFLNFGRRIAQCNVDKADIKDVSRLLSRAISWHC
jgi:ABC-type lipoprotein export system ATPase subunit